MNLLWSSIIGSFYGLEAAFGLVDGVVTTATGYFGGSTVKPSYRQVANFTS